MRRLWASGIVLAAAATGALVLPSPTSAQEGPGLQMAVSAARIDAGQPITVKSLSPCLSKDPAAVTQVDVNVSVDGEGVAKARFITFAPEKPELTGDWTWTWESPEESVSATYTVTALCQEVDASEDPENPVFIEIEDYEPVTFVVKKPDRIGPADPEPLRPDSRTGPPADPIGSGFGAPELPPAPAVPGTPGFTG
jgi:hypothetical protein